MSFRPPDLSHVPLRYLYWDLDLAVVVKPSGLLSVSAKDPTITDFLTARIKQRFSFATGPISVHRLDMETSGLMVVGLNPAAHRHLSIQFQDRKVFKRYEAVLDGIVNPEQGEIDLAFRLDVDNRPYQIYDPEKGKRSISKYWVKAYEGQRTRITYQPLTGRTHQLRLHSAHEKALGCPIIGDRLYGEESSGPRLMLHACQLSFSHPVSGAHMHFRSRAPF